MKFAICRFAVLGILGLPGVAQAYLLEQDAYSFLVGYTIGDPVEHWKVFQPFDVTADHWDITSIGVDGFTVSDGGNTGAMLRLMPDDGTGRPDENRNLGNRRVDFPSNAGAAHWTDVELTARLTQGRYWIRLSPGNNVYWSAIYNSQTGLTGFSRADDGTELTNTFATVLRIDGTAVPEPAPFLAVALWCGGLVASRRLRSYRPS